MQARRTSALLGLLATLLVLVAACGSSNSAAGGGSSSKTLVIDNSFDLKTADPQRAYEFSSAPIIHVLYDTLLTFKGSNTKKLVPDLATSYSESPDAQTFTFQLNHNAKFSNGDPVTAQDVVFSFNRLINIQGNPAFLLANVTPQAEGQYTVVLHSSVPNPALPYIIPTPALGIVDAKVVEAHGGTDATDASTADKAETWLNNNSAGSGPYTLQTFSTTSQVVMVANPHYWGSEKPHYQKIVMRNVQAPTQLLDVQRGSNELATDLSATQAKSLHGNSKVKVYSQPSPNMIYLFANQNPQISAVSSNPKVVQAIRLALNYEGLVKLAGQGAAQAPGVVPSSFLGALPASDAVKTNLAQAKSLVQQSGVSNPTLNLAYPSDISVNGLQFADLAQRIKADLAQAGITVNLAGSPVATALDAFRNGQEQLGLWYWGPDYPDPNDYTVFVAGGEVALRAGWTQAMDPSLATAAAQASSESNAQQRASQFQAIQQKLNQTGPFFPLIAPAQVLATTSNMTNVAFNSVWTVDFAELGSGS